MGAQPPSPAASQSPAQGPRTAPERSLPPSVCPAPGGRSLWPGGVGTVHRTLSQGGDFNPRFCCPSPPATGLIEPTLAHPRVSLSQVRGNLALFHPENARVLLWTHPRSPRVTGCLSWCPWQPGHPGGATQGLLRLLSSNRKQ